MPTIDVTEALDSFDISGEAFTVIRRQEIVNNFGESTVITTEIPALGAVQPGSEQDLLREEGQDAQAKSLKIFTTFRLRGVSRLVGNRYKPDQILWNNNLFEVKTVTSYASFGAGYVEADCTAIDYVDYPPMARPTSPAILDFRNPYNTVLGGGAQTC